MLIYNFFNIKDRLRLCHPIDKGVLRADDAVCGGFVAPSGRCRWWVASYRQLRSLRSLASGYGYVALRADDAACGGFVAPSGRCRWWVASYRQLRSLCSLASGYGYVALRADDARRTLSVVGGILPPAALTSFACKRLRLCRPTGG